MMRYNPVGILAGLPPRRLATIVCAFVGSVLLVFSLFGLSDFTTRPLDVVDHNEGPPKVALAPLMPSTSACPVPSACPVLSCPPVVESSPAPTPTPTPTPAPALAIAPPAVPLGYVATCGNETHAKARKLWLEADARYAHLRDDKFTIAILTYKRPDVLKKTLSVLLSATIPSLHEIVIIWNEIDVPPPASYTTPSGIPIRYRLSARNSLNMRLLPDPLYATQAILQHDDDVWYTPSDLEFVFQVWRQLGRYRLTGALPRCYSRDAKTKQLSYHQCRKDNDWYALVLTGLAFVHVSLMDYYSSNATMPTRIRAHVDEVVNCEDLAMNYIVSMLTCQGPLHVMGNEHFQNMNPKGGISTKGGHMSKRNKCLNVFEELVGFMPLVQQMGSVQRGLPLFA